MNELTIVQQDPRTLVQLAVLSLGSPASRRNYAREIAKFLTSGRPLNREGIQAHMIALRETGAGPVTRNVSLAAIRLLAREANARGDLEDSTLGAIERIKCSPIRGSTVGNWLDLAGVKAMLKAAEQREHGSRDCALVSVMLGCGLRRAEVCALDWDQWAERQNRWCWIDLKGKGQRVRTVPAPRWVADRVEEWKEKSISGSLVRPFHMTPQNAYLIVQETARAAGLPDLSPHDLRRTYARLSREGGASLEQISQTLGHASIQTTEKYLGTQLELREGKACGDHIRLEDSKLELSI